jgi:hypothetical protein
MTGKEGIVELIDLLLLRAQCIAKVNYSSDKLEKVSRKRSFFFFLMKQKHAITLLYVIFEFVCESTSVCLLYEEGGAGFP